MRLILIFALLALTLSVPSLETIDKYLLEGYEVLDHKFGALHLNKISMTGTDNVVVWPKLGFFTEKEHFESYYNQLIYRQSNPINVSTAIEECVESSAPDFFKFAPTLVGTLLPDSSVTTYSAPCFTENSIQVTLVDNNTVQIVHNVSNATSELCQDAYLYTTTQNFHLTSIFFSGSHTTTFANLDAAQLQEIQDNGIFVFRFCDRLYNDLPDVLMTALLFLGGFSTNPNIPVFGSYPPFWMVDLNVDFIDQATGYQWQQRPEAAQETVVQLNKSLIKSGDYLAVTRFDGLDQIIEYGAGSHSGHSTVAFWVDEELYILESQAGWYWPRSGIQMNTYDQWIVWAKDAGFHVTWLPLKEEYSQQFNTTAAFEWFKSIEGTPYGYHNFIFGWIDTVNTSYPPLLAPELVAPVFSAIEYFSPEATQEVFSLGINKRMNTTNLTVTELAQVIYEANLTFPEVYAIPEQDSWIYPDGYSLVCSSFVVGLWKAGGLFDGLTIQATEFTPKDLYQVVFIDPSPTVPENCQQLDPSNTYCQIMGKYRMQFPGISTVTPYTNMNQVCPSEPPLYFRPDGC
jgi:hypothetical protein